MCKYTIFNLVIQFYHIEDSMATGSKYTDSTSSFAFVEQWELQLSLYNIRSGESQAALTQRKGLRIFNLPQIRGGAMVCQQKRKVLYAIQSATIFSGGLQNQPAYFFPFLKKK